MRKNGEPHSEHISIQLKTMYCMNVYARKSTLKGHAIERCIYETVCNMLKSSIVDSTVEPLGWDEDSDMLYNVFGVCVCEDM